MIFPMVFPWQGHLKATLQSDDFYTKASNIKEWEAQPLGRVASFFPAPRCRQSYWYILIYIDVYWCILMYIDVYWCILIYIDVYWWILMYTDVYWCILMYIEYWCTVYLTYANRQGARVKVNGRWASSRCVGVRVPVSVRSIGEIGGWLMIVLPCFTHWLYPQNESMW